MATYCFSDIHGQYNLFQQIKDYIQPNDIVYCLGDCGDRGKDGWKIIKEVYNNPQFFYLKGNHEDMLVEAMKGNKELCFLNGGKSTYKAWKYKDGANKSWISKLQNLPYQAEYINTQGQKVLLSHAGFTPGKNITEEILLWDRSHFSDFWTDKLNNSIVVHGHTPIHYMNEYYCDAPEEDKVIPGAFWYFEDNDGKPHKVNIDCGSAFSGYITLLNLDTFEQHIFMAEDCIYEG